MKESENERPRANYLLALAAAAVLIIVVNVAAYSSSLSVPFTFDDSRWILDNKSIRVEKFTARNVLDLVRPRLEQRRPLANFSLALNYRIAGFAVRGYHIFNLIVHVLNALLLFFILLLALQRFPTVTMPVAAATSAALLWSLQPYHTQAVTYVIQRMTSMATTFYLLGIMTYLLGRNAAQTRQRRLFFIATALCGLCGMLTKEIAATFPFFILLIEYCLFAGQGDKSSGPYVKTLLILCAVVFLGGSILVGPSVVKEMQERYSELWFTMGQRLLTEPRVVLYYMTLVCFPFLSRLRVEYDYGISQSLIDPWTTLPSLIIVLALIGLGIALLFPTRLSRGKPRPLPGLLILWFFGQLFIESSFYPLDMAFEHRLYLPTIVPLSLPVLYLFSGKIKTSRVLALIIIAGLLLAFLTHRRNQVWADSMGLAKDTFKKSPDNFRTAARLGELLVQVDQKDKALRYYEWAIEKKPDDARMHFNKGLCLEQLGRLEEARIELEKALAITEKFPSAYMELGNIYDRTDQSDKALNYYQRAVEQDPEYVMAHNNLGQWYSNRGMYGPAEEQFRQALSLNPKQALALRNLGMLLIETDRESEALPYLTQAVEANPDSADPVFVMGLALTKLRRFQEAAEAFNAACALKPDWTLAWYNLGEVLRGAGNKTQARLAYENALKVAGTNDAGLIQDIKEGLAGLDQQ